MKVTKGARMKKGHQGMTRIFVVPAPAAGSDAGDVHASGREAYSLDPLLDPVESQLQPASENTPTPFG